MIEKCICRYVYFVRKHPPTQVQINFIIIAFISRRPTGSERLNPDRSVVTRARYPLIFPSSLYRPFPRHTNTHTDTHTRFLELDPLALWASEEISKKLIYFLLFSSTSWENYNTGQSVHYFVGKKNPRHLEHNIGI